METVKTVFFWYLMSSIQYGLPLATNKVLDTVEIKAQENLDATNAFRKSENQGISYYIEPVAPDDEGDDTITCKYLAHIKYINGITLHGFLCSFDFDVTLKWNEITSNTIEGVILSKGRLYDRQTMMPYYVDTVRTVSANPYILFSNDINENQLAVVFPTMTIKSSEYTITSYVFNYTKQTMTKTPNIIISSPDIVCGAFIQFTEPVGKGDNKTNNNKYYYVRNDDIPLKYDDSQTCFRFTKK